MQRCSKCDYCQMDLVAQYVKGLDLHRCSKKGNSIFSPYSEGKDCTEYKKKTFDNEGMLRRIIGKIG